MISKFLKMVILTFVLGIISPPAYAQYIEKDSFDYMVDDGIFSPEEKDEEAELIKERCEVSTMERAYYDCGCLAGAFRIRRDDPKLMPQSNLFYSLLEDENSPCADPVKIAGNVYTECQEYAKVFRSREKEEDNEKFCSCAANKVATQFSKKPKMDSSYISDIRVKAMSSCDNTINKLP